MVKIEHAPFMEDNPLPIPWGLEADNTDGYILQLYEHELDGISPDDMYSGEKKIPFSGAMQTADELPDRKGLRDPTCSEQTWTVDTLDPDGGLWDTGDVEED